MPLYEFKCKWCKWKDDIFFITYEESLIPRSCPVCEAEATRLFPLPHVNIMNASYRPGAENKWNWNPARAFSNKRGGGAEYEHKRRELRTGKSRFDIGKHKHEWAHHLKGTVRERRRRKAAANVH